MENGFHILIHPRGGCHGQRFQVPGSRHGQQDPRGGGEDHPAGGRGLRGARRPVPLGSEDAPQGVSLGEGQRGGGRQRDPHPGHEGQRRVNGQKGHQGRRPHPPRAPALEAGRQEGGLRPPAPGPANCPQVSRSEVGSTVR